jgi:hypothetical protein
MHMFIKAYAKTRGTTRLYPILAPINMGHINADGFVASCVARYTQVRRRRITFAGLAAESGGLQQRQQLRQAAGATAASQAVECKHWGG